MGRWVRMGKNIQLRRAGLLEKLILLLSFGNRRFFFLPTFFRFFRSGLFRPLPSLPLFSGCEFFLFSAPSLTSQRFFAFCRPFLAGLAVFFFAVFAH